VTIFSGVVVRHDAILLHRIDGKALTMPVMLLEPLWPNAAADTIRLATRARSVDRMESETRRVIVALWKTSKMVRARWQDVQRLWPEAQASQRDSVQDPCGLLPEEQHLFRANEPNKWARSSAGD